MINKLSKLLNNINFFYKVATIEVSDSVSKPISDWLLEVYELGTALFREKELKDLIKDVEDKLDKMSNVTKTNPTYLLYNKLCDEENDKIREINYYQNKLSVNTVITPQGYNIIFERDFTFPLSNFGEDFKITDDLINYRYKTYFYNELKKIYKIVKKDPNFRGKSKEEIDKEVNSRFEPLVQNFEAETTKLKKINKITIPVFAYFGKDLLLNGGAAFSNVSPGIVTTTPDTLKSPFKLTFEMSSNNQLESIQGLSQGNYELPLDLSKNVTKAYLTLLKQIVKHELRHGIQSLIKFFQLMSDKGVGGLGPQETIEDLMDFRGKVVPKRKDLFDRDPKFNLFLSSPLYPVKYNTSYLGEEYAVFRDLKTQVPFLSPGSSLNYSPNPYSAKENFLACLKILIAGAAGSLDNLDININDNQQLEQLLESLDSRKINQLSNNAKNIFLDKPKDYLPIDPNGNPWSSRNEYLSAVEEVSAHLRDYVDNKRIQQIKYNDNYVSKHEYKDVEYQTRLADAVWAFQQAVQTIPDRDSKILFFKAFTSQISQDQFSNEINEKIRNKKRQLGKSELTEAELNSIMPNLIIFNQNYKIENSTFRQWKELAPEKYKNALKVIYLEGLVPYI